MEALRADELFSTGTVIEQIWEQIQKSKILLADLTGKNANVFYELGLAHAATKPVVFTSGILIMYLSIYSICASSFTTLTIHFGARS